MGSGINSSAQGKYQGLGAGGDVEVKSLGFKPKVLKIRSDQGEVVMQEGMPGAWFQTDAAVPSYLADGLVELTEFGFKVSGNTAGINTAAKDYYFEAY